MKKIYILVIACVLVISTVLAPAAYTFAQNYVTHKCEKEISMHISANIMLGINPEVKRGDKIIRVMGENLNRLDQILSYSKIKTKSLPEDCTEDKERIIIEFKDGLKLTVINYYSGASDGKDIAYMIYENGTKTYYFKYEALGVYNWVADVTDADGFYVPNKVLDL